MYKIYEIRNKHTHRVEYLNLFHVDEIPNEIYKKNPDYEKFRDNLDLYLTVREEDYMSEEHAWQNVLFYFKEFKIQLEPSTPVEEPKKEQPVQEQPKKKSTRTKKETPAATKDLWPKATKGDWFMEDNY
jgi:hypothetical protein